MTVATLVLAAGGSTRLGQPKQLLTLDGQTLVRRITDVALSLAVGPVVVVLGANHERINVELDERPVQVVVNADWREGMASSLRAGLLALPNESVDAFLILLTDQPLVTADLLRQLIHTHQRTGRGIVACRYGGATDNSSAPVGVPALFASRYRTEFLNLAGDVGARKLIQQHAADCAEVPFAEALIDLDTQQDVANWQAGLPKQRP